MKPPVSMRLDTEWRPQDTPRPYDPDEIIGWAVRQFAGRRIVMTTAFGMEGVVLLDKIAAHVPDLRVISVDTAFLFEETHRLRERLAALYPRVRFEWHHPRLTPEQQAEIHGPALWERDPDRCCRIRKLDPMRRVMENADVWFSALRREQSPAREDIGVVDWNWRYQVIRVCPLAAWSRRQVHRYLEARGLPYNELHDRHYPSVGCTHCTQPVTGVEPWEYSREGRWVGFGKTECGLHENGAAPKEQTMTTNGRNGHNGQSSGNGRNGLNGHATNDDGPALSKVEIQKRESDYLRGSIAETLDDDGADRFADRDLNVLKFHGVYQQYDRDDRAENRSGRSERRYSLMVRASLPGGVLRPEQWLVLDDLARRHGGSSLRLTTRQSIQFHGILKGDLRGHIREMNEALVRTLAACGDIARNVMCCPAVIEGSARRAAQETAQAIARALAPRTSAYHEIWLDGERVELPSASGARNGAPSSGPEPLYGPLYLPRKFKVAVALPDDNCVDVYTQDVGLVAILDDAGRDVVGYHLLVGGGLGMTHRKADTFARLATPVGVIDPDEAIDAVRTAVGIFRDHGDRGDRRHARLKYLIEERGVAWFIGEFNRRAGFSLRPAPAPPRTAHRHHLGWTDQGDGLASFGLFVENGRLTDDADTRALSAVREIVRELRPGVRVTPHQNLLFTHVRPDQRRRLVEILRAHDLPVPEEVSAVRVNSMACPALPTCGLALADAERALPGLIDRLEPVLEELGLDRQDLGVRMTGCPNGCARPYTADLALVGRSPGVYDVYVGGRLAGDRLVDLLAERVAEDDLIDRLLPVLQEWRDERWSGEGLGDWWQRRTGRLAPRTVLTGDKTPVDLTVEGAAPEATWQEKAS